MREVKFSVQSGLMVIGFLLAVSHNVAWADGAGTDFKLTLSPDGHVSLAAGTDQQIIYGTAQVQAGYAVMPVDALWLNDSEMARIDVAGSGTGDSIVINVAGSGTGIVQPSRVTDNIVINVAGSGTGDAISVQAGWGIAEILLGCHTVDLIIYQWDGQQITEVWTGAIPHSTCMD